MNTCKRILQDLGEKFAREEVGESEATGCNHHPDAGKGVAQILRLKGTDTTCSATSSDKNRQRVCACKGGKEEIHTVPKVTYKSEMLIPKDHPFLIIL